MQQYKLYECEIESLPKTSVYSHYENGRLLIYHFSRTRKGWRKLTTEEIKNLSEHERRWYNNSRNEINAKYLNTPEVQRLRLDYANKVLDLFEENLKKIKNANTKNESETKNAENETG